VRTCESAFLALFFKIARNSHVLQMREKIASQTER